MSILCPTDFTEHAREGSEVAAAFAARLHQPLVLVHVSAERAHSREAREATTALRELANELAASGAEVIPVLRFGTPHRVLARCLCDYDTRLVVAGARSHDVAPTSTTGTMVKLGRLAEVPVLLVRQGGALSAWLRGERALRVMVGVDASPFTEAARNWLLGLRRLGELELIAARVTYPPEECKRLSLARPRAWDVPPEELTRCLEAEIRDEAGALVQLTNFHTRLIVGMGHVGSLLVAAAEEEHVDLLVIGTRQKRALGKLVSVSYFALRSARTGVLVVPATTAVAERGLVPDFAQPTGGPLT